VTKKTTKTREFQRPSTPIRKRKFHHLREVLKQEVSEIILNALNINYLFLGSRKTSMVTAADLGKESVSTDPGDFSNFP